MQIPEKSTQITIIIIYILAGVKIFDLTYSQLNLI
jgi:hypothetical protein